MVLGQGRGQGSRLVLGSVKVGAWLSLAWKTPYFTVSATVVFGHLAKTSLSVVLRCGSPGLVFLFCYEGWGFHVPSKCFSIVSSNCQNW